MDRMVDFLLAEVSDFSPKAQFLLYIAGLWESTGSIYNTALIPKQHRELPSHGIAQFDVVGSYFITIYYLSGEYVIVLEDSSRMSFCETFRFKDLNWCSIELKIRECKMRIYDLCNPGNPWRKTHLGLP